MASLNKARRRNKATGKLEDYWSIRWRDGRRKQHTKGLGYISKAQAKRELKIFEGQLAEEELLGRTATPAPTRIPTLTEFLNKAYLKKRRAECRPGTLESDRSSRVAIERTIGHLPLDQITTAEIEHHATMRFDEPPKRNMRAKVKPATVNGDLVYLRGALLHALDLGLISSMPKLKRRKQNEPPRPWLTESDTRCLLRAMQPLRFGRRWYAYICTFIAVNTGMRLRELLSRQWADVKWNVGEHGAIVVYDQPMVGFQPKTASARRTLPLTREVRQELEAWHHAHGCPTTGLLFPSPKNENRPRQSFRRQLQKACLAAGIQVVSPHALRRTWASRLAVARVDRATLMRLGGWKTPAMIDRVYAQVADSHVANVAIAHGISG